MNRIRELRQEKGLTQKELGLKLELAESTISLYESGKREPDIATLIRLADFFEVSTDYLLNRVNKSTSGQELSAARVSGGRDYSDLTPEQIEKLKSYEAFLRSQSELEDK